MRPLSKSRPPMRPDIAVSGVAVDIAREAMEQASVVVGEINPRVPFTFGDTIVSVSDFDLLVKSTEPPNLFQTPARKQSNRSGGRQHCTGD